MDITQRSDVCDLLSKILGDGDVGDSVNKAGHKLIIRKAGLQVHEGSLSNSVHLSMFGILSNKKFLTKIIQVEVNKSWLLIMCLILVC